MHYIFFRYCLWYHICLLHYSDVIMSATPSQITGVSIVCSTICWDTDHRKHLRSASLAFCIDRWIPLIKGQWRGKCFHLMTSSCGMAWLYCIWYICDEQSNIYVYIYIYGSRITIILFELNTQFSVIYSPWFKSNAYLFIIPCCLILGLFISEMKSLTSEDPSMIFA